MKKDNTKSILIKYNNSTTGINLNSNINSEKYQNLNEITHKLTERVKELNCLYGISKLVETSNLTLNDILQKSVELIPLAWQYPEITCARIKIKGREFITSNFRETQCKQEENITVYNNLYGKIEVFYLEDRPVCDEGPFLKEERLLIHAIAERLGHIIERRLADERLQTLYKKERKLRKQLEEEMQNRIDYTRKLIHELKTPLTSLLATSQLLHEEIKGKKLGKLARYVWDNACNINNRIDELHDIIKGEIGKLDLELKNINLKKILTSIVEESQTLARQNNMLLELYIDSPLPRVYADPQRVRQIILNLLNNAFKYATGSDKVLVKAISDSRNVIIEVKDWGPGINIEEQKRIFEPYYSSNHKLHTSHGLGIGLALCKVLVEAQGGKIWVESKPRQGASFFFSLRQPLKNNKIYTGK